MTRVAVTYRVCQHWRAHIFAKLNAHPELEVMVFHGSSLAGTKLINGENLQGFAHREHFTIRLPLKNSWVFHPFLWISLLRYRPHVILAEGGSNFLTNFLVLMYARTFRCPVIWWTLGELRGKQYNGFVAKLYRRLVVFQEKCCDVYLGYSDVAREYFRRMGYPDEDSFIAVNCVDTNRVFGQIAARADEVEQLRNGLQLSGKKVALFVGAFTHAKRIDRLIRVFADLSELYPESVLLLVGDGPVRSTLDSLVVELGIRHQVIFTGSIIDNVSDYYELGDVFVLPGLGGLAISEAMTHGLPVICTIADGCELNYVVDDETGYRLFSDNDQEVEVFLRDCLMKLLSDDTRRSRMALASRERIEKVHNVDTYVRGIIDAIQHAKRKRRLDRR